jgi:hypothetical protein
MQLNWNHFATGSGYQSNWIYGIDFDLRNVNQAGLGWLPRARAYRLFRSKNKWFFASKISLKCRLNVTTFTVNVFSRAIVWRCLFRHQCPIVRDIRTLSWFPAKLSKYLIISHFGRFIHCLDCLQLVVPSQCRECSLPYWSFLIFLML